MTHRLNDLSRRNMFTIAAGGASALAVGRMLGGTAFAAAPKVKPLTDAQLPQGLLTVPGDVKLDPATEAFARKLLARMKQSVLDAATRPGEMAKTDQVAAASSKLVASLRTSRLTRVKAAFKPGSKYKEVAEMTKVEPKRAHEMYAMELKDLIELKKAKLKVPKEEKPQWQGPLARKIEFQLNTVKCVRTTTGGGADEILMGGTIVTPGGVTKKIADWKVGGFDKDDVRRYDFSKCKDFPPGMPQDLVHQVCPRGNPNDVFEGRRLESTRLNIDIPWPATIALVLTMGEADGDGGFGEIVQEVYAKIESEVKKKLVELGVKAGEALGGAVGAAIGAALATVVGEFLDWLVSLFSNEDDFINSKSWVVQLGTPEMNKIQQISSSELTPPAGVLASAMKKLTFVGDGGKYETRLHWRVST